MISLTTVVWSRRLKRYVLRTFHRTHPDAKAFLVHLGRSFVTEVTLRVSENQNLRCVSRVDIPASEIFASPGTPGRTFASFVDTAGRVEAIWFPFTAKPWLKTWSVSPEKPPESREVSGPYNYAFSDNLPEELTDLVGQMLSGNAAVTPLFGQMEYEISANGLAATNAFDLWGKSKNTLLYIRPTTLRVDELGLAVITDRARIQQVLHEVASYYSMRLDQLRAQGKFRPTGHSSSAAPASIGPRTWAFTGPSRPLSGRPFQAGSKLGRRNLAQLPQLTGDARRVRFLRRARAFLSLALSAIRARACRVVKGLGQRGERSLG